MQNDSVKFKMFMKKDCIFCKIVKEKLEPFIYEDKKVIALASKYSTNPGHMVVFLKKHTENMNGISINDYLHLQKVVKRYYKQLMKNYKPEKIYIMLLAEEVEHIHFHLIPRYKNDPMGPRILLKKQTKIKDFNKVIRKINK